jgi:hypothetical protein
MISVPCRDGWGRRQAPFLALAKVASANASSRFSFPARADAGQPRQHLFQLAAENRLLETAMAGPVRRTLLRHFAPLRPDLQHLQHPVQYRPRSSRDYPPAPPVTAQAPPRPTVHRSAPGVLSRHFPHIPEQPRDRTKSLRGTRLTGSSPIGRTPAFLRDGVDGYQSDSAVSGWGVKPC